MTCRQQDDTPFPSMSRRGFTLLELLIVFAIISLLAAMLLPAFALARSKARQSSCASNQKQIGAALLQYVQDNDETYPLAIQEEIPDSGVYWGYSQLLMPYVESIQVFYCPDLPDIGPYGPVYSPLPTLPHGQFVPYGLNDYMDHGGYLNPPSHGRYSAGQIHYPAELLLTVDTNQHVVAGQCYGIAPKPESQAGIEGGSYGYAAACFSTDSNVEYYPAFPPPPACVGPDARHSGSANVGFADGHVKSIRFEELYYPPPGVKPIENWHLWYPSAE